MKNITLEQLVNLIHEAEKRADSHFDVSRSEMIDMNGNFVISTRYLAKKFIEHFQFRNNKFESEQLNDLDKAKMQMLFEQLVFIAGPLEQAITGSLYTVFDLPEIALGLKNLKNVIGDNEVLQEYYQRLKTHIKEYQKNMNAKYDEFTDNSCDEEEYQLEKIRMIKWLFEKDFRMNR